MNIEETNVNSESTETGKRTARHGKSARLVILLLFLVVVGAGCIYEFSVARPAFQEAWEKIRKVDEGPTSSEFTSEQIQEMMGRPPANTDDSLHDECVVETYRWPSGMLVKSHDIHIVYTKLKKAIEESQPKLKGKLYYYSASAGQPLDLDNNFPQERQTIVINLNAPTPSMGGGGPPQGRGGGAGNAKGEENKEEESSDDKEGSDSKDGDKSEDKSEEKAEEKAEDKAAEEKEHSHEGEGDHSHEGEEGEHSHEEKSEGSEKKSDEKEKKKEGEEKSDG